MSVVREMKSFGKEQAIIYLVGDKDARVHFEPKTDEPRIFMSVLLGSQDQINELKNRWKK